MGIEITIIAGLTPANSRVTATGSVQHVITDTEINSFAIQDQALKNAIDKYFGKAPNDAYLHSDTPWGDLYKTYNWPQVQVVLVAESATITGISSDPVIVATQTFTNNSAVKGIFNGSLSQQVANTMSSTWSQTDSITVGQKITYKATILPGIDIGGETSISYAHTWGQSTSESMTITLGTQSGVSVPLDPGESVEAQLSASRGVMKVRIVYKAYLVGATAINYDPTFKDHHFWALNIDQVMEAGGISNVKTITEDIEIGFYSNAKIQLLSKSGKSTVAYLDSVRAA